MFLNSIADVTAAISGGPTEGVDFATRFAPMVRKIEREYVEPFFPAALIERLQTATPAPAFHANEVTLKAHITEGVAHLATWKFSFVGAVVQTGSGLQTFQNEQFRDSAKYAKQDFRHEHELDGFQCLELALYYAVMNKANITGFADSDEYKQATARLLNFSRDSAITYTMSSLTFKALTGNIEYVETEIIVPLLGQTYYDELREVQYDRNLSVSKKALISKLRGAISSFAIRLALEMNMVTLEGGRVFVRGYRNNDDKDYQDAPRKDLYEVAMAARERLAYLYLTSVKDFLAANATVLEWTDPSAAVVFVAPEDVTQVGIKSL